MIFAAGKTVLLTILSYGFSRNIRKTAEFVNIGKQLFVLLYRICFLSYKNGKQSVKISTKQLTKRQKSDMILLSVRGAVTKSIVR